MKHFTFLSLLLVVLLSFACGSEPKTESQTPPPAETETKPLEETSTEITYAPTVEDIMGTWSVGELVAHSEVSAMDGAGFADFTAQYPTFEYESGMARAGEEILDSPSYLSEVISKGEFKEQYQINPEDLGLMGPEVHLIRVQTTEGENWTNPGSVLIQVAEGALLSVWDGGFFELVEGE